LVPTVLFGHSFGGLVVFEFFRKLSALKLDNFRIVKLILSAVKNPLDLTAFNTNSMSKFHYNETNDELSDYIKSIGGTIFY
jgi:surfactin synthase thioesterase subunit